ncbi:MAG: hypothetical protein KGZ83_18880 [Sulfuricella sp.]|nr:hypothetical protein [Sulfuricella sp.]
MTKHFLTLLLLVFSTSAWADMRFFDQLEAKSGKSLTLDQRFQVSKALKACDDQERDQDARLVGEVARLTGLPAGQILQMARLEGSLAAKIESTLKRKLGESLVRQIRAAEEARRSSIQAARQAVAARLGSISGLSPQTVIDMLPGFGL